MKYRVKAVSFVKENPNILQVILSVFKIVERRDQAVRITTGVFCATFVGIRWGGVPLKLN